MPGRSVMVVDVRDVELEVAVSRAAERIARRVRDDLTTRRTQRHRDVSSGARLPAA